MKKRIVTIALVIALLATCFGGTLAYLTDYEAQTNTFTTGNVYITMDEAEVMLDENTESDTFGDLIPDGEKRTSGEQEYKLFPGMTVTKDPTIYVEGTEPAYIAAKIIIRDTTSSAKETKTLHDLIGVKGYDNINIHALASGGLIKTDATQKTDWNGLSMVYETAECVIYQDADKANSTWTMYIFMNEKQAVGTEIVLFDTLTIPADWNNQEMLTINGMQIEVQAYAAQTNGFVDCFDAMTSAFDSDFPFAAN